MDVRLDIAAIGCDSATRRPVVMLREHDGDRFLCVNLGRAELFALVQAVDGITVQRPSTHDLLIASLRVGQVQLVAVHVEHWRDEVFRADLVGEHNGEPIAIDARLSDALAMAARLQLPLYAAPGLLRRFGLREGDGAVDLVRLEDLDPEDFGGYVM